MFDLENDRKIYSDLLQPPEGYELEKAICTTYSLDLVSLMSICICLGQDTDMDETEGSENSILLDFLKNEVMKKIILFCDAGQIKSNKKSEEMLKLLDKMVHSVTTIKNDKRFAFHPKIWFIVYKDKKKNDKKKYKFVALSRNLTDSKNLDIVVALDGEGCKKDNSKSNLNKVISKLFNYLDSDRNSGVIINGGNKEYKKVIQETKKEIKNIQFKDSEKYRIFFPGIEDDIKKDDLFNNKEGEVYKEVAIMSPFISKNVIEKIFKKTKRLALVTLKDELLKLKSSKCIEKRINDIDIYVINESMTLVSNQDDGTESNDDTIDGNNNQNSVENKINYNDDIHAKIYITENKEGNVNIYLGSLNASNNGLNGNVECLVKLMKEEYSCESFKKDLKILDDNGENTINSPFVKIDFATIKEQKDDCKIILNNELQIVINEVINRINKAKVDNDDNLSIILDNEKPIKLNSENGKYNKIEIRISPYCISDNEVISKEFKNDDEEIKLIDKIKFKVNNKLMSRFYVLKILAEKIFDNNESVEQSIERMITIDTEGIVENRDLNILSEIVNNGEKLVKLLMAMTNNDLINDWCTENAILNKNSGKHYGIISLENGLYENLLKFSYKNKEWIDKISYIIDHDGMDKDILYKNTYTILKAIKDANGIYKGKKVKNK